MTGPTILRSWRASDLCLPRVELESGSEFSIPRPPVLRLPVVPPAAVVHRIDLAIPRPAVRSFRFERTEPLPLASPPPRAEPREPAIPPTGRPLRRARLVPPRDVVKPEEKFFYLLQPDLETMLQADRLEFPRQPFPFQLDGMAFLVPRHGAVLADEMGLGKSMQAISSIRLLVRSGDARRVLVVCPKGLVSNWARDRKSVV